MIKEKKKLADNFSAHAKILVSFVYISTHADLHLSACRVINCVKRACVFLWDTPICMYYVIIINLLTGITGSSDTWIVSPGYLGLDTCSRDREINEYLYLWWNPKNYCLICGLAIYVKYLTPKINLINLLMFGLIRVSIPMCVGNLWR